MSSDCRCSKCSRQTGVQPDGRFVPYTLHPHRVAPGAGRAVAIFCAACFDSLGNAEARDRAAQEQAV
jgi:hypothetical protein